MSSAATPATASSARSVPAGASASTSTTAALPRMAPARSHATSIITFAGRFCASGKGV
jgi:hypothetical protein